MSKLSKKQVIEKFKEIKLLALDVDGVLTDDAIYFGPDGFEMKKFNISDGLFIVLAMRSGLELAIVSGRNSKATETRMKDLGIQHILQGMKDKTSMIAPLLEELGIEFSETAFVGNEILDIKLASKVGLSFAVSDSTNELIESVNYVTENGGGKGAVREVIEMYFEAMNIDAKSLLV